MRYFLRFLLALVMAALLVVTYGSIQAVGNQNSKLEKVTNMASRKSKRGNNVKQNSLQTKENGLLLEIRGPENAAISIPENKPGATAPLSFSVRFTNNTQAPVPFIHYGALIPEIFGPSGQALHRREPINRQVASGEYHGSLVGVGKQTDTYLEGRLSWQQNSLQLILHDPIYDGIPIDLDKSWSFDTVGAGEYQIRFTYETPSGTILYPDPVTFIETRQEIGIEVTGSQLATPLAKFRLLQPVGLNNSAVEVDGIRFETFIPEPLLTLPNKNDSSSQSVRIGIRITNNTLTPFYFSFYNTFYPDLVMPDGEVKRGAYGNDWIRAPEEFDFLLVTPGKSLTFFPGIRLLWTNHSQFSLGVSIGYGGYCAFEQLKPGIYHFRFQYDNTRDTIPKKNLAGESIATRPIEKVWTGWVDTPFVEFHLIEL